MKRSLSTGAMVLVLSCIIAGTTACGPTPDVLNNNTEEALVNEYTSAEAEDFYGLKYESSVPIDYAQGFSIDFYKGGYTLITVYGDATYLVVPEGKDTPEDISSEIVVLKGPLDNIYLAATSAMSLFDAVDAIDNITLSGTAAEGWYVESAKTAMESGAMAFAGKYSEPDYELIINSACDLAIESTMIYHTPKVKEMLEKLGIPVFVDRSSYESHPLGRTEWIKVYGALVGKTDEAIAFFDQQKQVVDKMAGFQNTEKTVVFFYVGTDGLINVRTPDDYIPKMIEIAGARYPFADVIETDPDSKKSTVSMSMEQFYSVAADADYLIYNASIDNPLNSLEELSEKSDLFADFKAVQTGNVWSTGKDLYQATATVGNLINDIHLMITGGDDSEMMFLHKVGI